MAIATRRIGVGHVTLSPSARAYVQAVLQSDRLTYGAWTRRFEAEFAEAHGRKFATFVNSGTDALRIGLGAMKEARGWKDWAKVLVPAVTFVATLNIVLQNNMTPVLVDVDDDYGMSSAVVPKDAVAAIPVHLFGHQTRTPDWLPVLDDACEAMLCGVTGDVSCFSTYAAHILSTGVGGLAITDDPHLAMLIRSLANHGRSGIYTSMDQPLGEREVMDARFNFERVGYSSRATEMEAALGVAELETVHDNIATRRRNARSLLLGLDDLPLVLPPWGANDSSWMMFPLMTRSYDERQHLTQHLERGGIETRPLLPLTNQPYLKRLFGPDVESRYPNARKINERGFYVGCSQHFTDEDMGYVVSVFKDFYR